MPSPVATGTSFYILPWSYAVLWLHDRNCDNSIQLATWHFLFAGRCSKFLCFRNLQIVPVFEKREREADYYPVENSCFCVPAISQFQFRQPLRFVDRVICFRATRLLPSAMRAWSAESTSDFKDLKSEGKGVRGYRFSSKTTGYLLPFSVFSSCILLRSAVC